MITVTIEQDDIKHQAKLWETTLIGYVIVVAPSDQQMDNYMSRVWGFVTKPKVLIHYDGYFIFKFYIMEDKETINQSLPYYCNNRSIIQWPWDMDFELNQELLCVIPKWVKFPRLPVGYWSAEALRKVASAIGKSIRINNYTTNMDRISYAWVLIKVDVSQLLPTSIHVKTELGLWEKATDYDWRPKLCNSCLIYGHDDQECWCQEKSSNAKDKAPDPNGLNNKSRKMGHPKWSSMLQNL